jgi:hypothetical protein
MRLCVCDVVQGNMWSDYEILALNMFVNMIFV